MTVAVLINGKIERAPEMRGARNGSKFATATVRTAAGSELQFWRVFAFSASVAAELMRLGEGDALALQGIPRFEIWRATDGEPRVSLSMTIDSVLALRQPPKQRKSKKEKPAPKPEPRMRAERCAGDTVDVFGDEIPF